MTVKRRTFISAGGLWLAPPAGIAQSARKVYRVGILTVATTAAATGPQAGSGSTAALLRGMRELGYVYGEHFVTEARGAGDQPERFPALAAELVRLAPDVIVGAGPSLLALKQATATIPVVMASSDDAVGAGLVHSLAHPGATPLPAFDKATDTQKLDVLVGLTRGKRLRDDRGGTIDLGARIGCVSARCVEVGEHQLIGRDPRCIGPKSLGHARDPLRRELAELGDVAIGAQPFKDRMAQVALLSPFCKRNQARDPWLHIGDGHIQLRMRFKWRF